jgi:outer membrane protein
MTANKNNMKNNFIKFALLATIYPTTLGAQSLQIPTQGNFQPVDVKPAQVAPEQVLSPQVLERGIGTMERLLSSAYAKNPAILAAREGLKTVDEQLNQAYSGFLPNINYTMTKSREKSSFDSAAEQKFYPNSNSLNLRQGLFGGGETYYAIKSAEARVTAAQNELKNVEQQFLLEAITAYIEYIYTQKVMGLAANNENVLREQLKSSKDRFVVGDATKTDVAQSEARLANATSNKVLAEGDFVSAKANFKKLFGVDAPEFLPMPSKLPDIPLTLEEAKSIAIKNNPQLNQAKYLAESRDNDINVQASQLLPQLDLNGSITKAKSLTAGGGIESDSNTVGLTLTVPIYTQGVTYSRTREARNRMSQAKEQYNDTVNSVKSGIVQAWQQIQTTRTNIEATKSSLVASEFALSGVREEQKEGARTILDVLDAEQERFSAETSHARAIKDSVIAIYSLKLVLGELNTSTLGLSVSEYDPMKHYNNTRFKLIGL